LRRVNARVVGVVLNRMPVHTDGYYYYYYSYGYSGYGEEQQDGNDRRNGSGRGRGRFGRRKSRVEERPAVRGVAPLPPGGSS
jgi:hypothetical protein